MPVVRPAFASGVRSGATHAGDVLDVSGIDEHSAYACGLQRSVRTLLINARALHDDLAGIKRRRPFRQRSSVPFECAEWSLLDATCAVGFFDDRTGRDL